MAFHALKTRVCAANIALVREGLVVNTWGNASALDRDRGVVIIKPSGVPYDTMAPEQMCVVNLDGSVAVPNGLNPSVDLPVHLALYNAFSGVGGIVHTHSHYATCWAQARRAIPCLGTTHADYFHGDVPITAPLEVEHMTMYEASIGASMIARMGEKDPLRHPAMLVAGHGPFVWGADVESALETALVLEEVARMAAHTLMIAADAPALERHVLDRHFERKHGVSAYYGQRS